MNIVEELKLNSEKPQVLVVKKTDKTKTFAVGLVEKQVLKKHITSVPALLMVLKGEISFDMNDEILILKEYDSFEIPVNVPHEVVGNEDENIFVIQQEL